MGKTLEQYADDEPLSCAPGLHGVKIRLTRRGARLGKGRYSLAAGDHGKVKILLTRKGRAALAKKNKVRVVASLVTAQGTRTTRRYVLKR